MPFSISRRSAIAFLATASAASIVSASDLPRVLTPLRMQIGASTIADMKAAYPNVSFVEKGYSSYTYGPIFNVQDHDSFDVPGLKDLAIVFDANQKLVAVVFRAPKKVVGQDFYRAMVAVFKSGYKTVSYDVPVEGDGDAIATFTDDFGNLVTLISPASSMDATYNFRKASLDKKIQARNAQEEKKN